MEEPKPRVREGAPPKPRRVYKGVGVGPQTDGLYPVLLDGRTAFTPLRAKLAAASPALADAVAKEWDAQDPHIDPETMPLTRLLATQIDRIGPQRGAVIASLIGYIDADSICYRAPYPADLCERQAQQWQPVLDWLSREHDLVLHTSEGAMPVAQPPGTDDRFRRILEGLDDTRLTAFQAAAALASSLALALALIFRRLSAGEVFAAAYLDEIYQAERWGEDKEAADRRKRIAGDLDAIDRYLTLSV